MDNKLINSLSPFVRFVKIQTGLLPSCEWLDYDNVFIYIASGETEYIIDGCKYLVKEGNVIIIPPFKVHMLGDQKNLVQYIFHFDAFYDCSRTFFKEIGNLYNLTKADVTEEELLFSEFCPVTFIEKTHQLHVKNRFLEMHKNFVKKNEHYELLLKSTAIELLTTFIRNASNYSHERSSLTKSWSTIEKAITFVNENYSDSSINNTSISGAIGVTPNYLTQIFKKHLGITLHSYVNHIRIENSKKLLLQNKKITEIADTVGISCIHVFSKLFKKTVGITPSEFIVCNNVHAP